MADPENLNNRSTDLNTIIDSYMHTTDDDNTDLITNALTQSMYHDISQLINTLERIDNCFNVIHLNIQSLLAKFDSFKRMLTELENKKIKLDAILLCETFLHEGNEHLYEIPGL